jgi:hypothetical protein
MDIKAIQQLYDLEMRKQAPLDVNQKLESAEYFTRLVSTNSNSGGNCLIYSKLDSQNADAAIDEQISYFKNKKQSFEWKLYEHDSPADLEDRLINKGFSMEETEALMVLELDSFSFKPENTFFKIKKISKAEELNDIGLIKKEISDDDFSEKISNLADGLNNTPDSISVYIAYADNKPVSCGWIRFYQDKQFADLWGGSTIPEYRSRGIYKGLVAIRAQEAINRNIKYLAIDARPMSKPIVEKLGFRLITTTTPFTL